MKIQARKTGIGIAVVIVSLLATAGALADPKVMFIHGGKPLECRIESLPDAQTLRVRTRTGLQTLKLDDIQQVDFGANIGRPSGGVIIEPPGGSRLYGRILSGDASSFQIHVRGLGKLTLPLDKVRVATNAAVDVGAAGPRVLAETRKGHREQDVLLLAVSGGIRQFPTLVRKMDASGLEVQWKDGTRQIDWNRIFSVVFATLDGGDASPPPARAILSDGSIIAGRILAFSKTHLTMAPGFVKKIAIPVGDLVRIEFSSEKLVYLSDRKPLSIEKSGFFGQNWPVRFDVSLTGQRLALGKVVYKKGIACHSQSAIHYELKGEFKTFAATIGIHDETKGLGSCIFRVTDGKGKVLFDSGEYTGKDKARTISVDVTGVKELVLVVDYGKDKDVGDNAVWADARVIKP